QISVATWLKSKYEPALTLKTTARPSTSAAANLLSRTTTLSIVRVKRPDSTAPRGSQLTSVRSGSANFIVRYGKTLEKPSRMQNQVSLPARTAALAPAAPRWGCCEVVVLF